MTNNQTFPTLPVIAATSPTKVKLEKNKKYFWCSCGLAKTQPFCDGSHKGSGFKSVPFEVTEDKEVYLCNCKQSKNGIYCDSSHNNYLSA